MAEVKADDVSTMHPCLVECLDKITRARDAYKGSDAIKDTSISSSYGHKGRDEEYLPKLSGQDQKDYESYKKRAVFYAAMARTVTALVGAIDRKPPTITNRDPVKEFLEDVTGTGVSFDEFLLGVETEVLISGRAVVCIDRKNSTDNRPYLVWYKNEDCVNWFSETYTDFDQRLSSMVFREEYYGRDPNNKFKQIPLDQYREFDMVDGQVSVNIWRQEETDGERTGAYEVFETYSMTNRGKALGFIPCVPIVSDGSPFGVPKPPLLDLVNINLAHYRNSADYEHGMHWTALPTPWFSGLNDRDANITLGSGTAIILPDPSASAGFLEFSGAGLGKISEALKHKEGMMSALGARMLASKMDQSTSAEVTRINYSGETAALSNIARSISRGATRLLRMVAIWENKKKAEKLVVTLNEDYIDTKLTAPDLAGLISAYQGGVMSLDTLLWNISQGERLPQDRTIEEEMELIEAGSEKEADTAMWYEDQGVSFEGNQFSSEAGSDKREDPAAEGEEAPKAEEGLFGDEPPAKPPEESTNEEEELL